MSEAGEIVGMVDVLKLTYATLDQINSMNTGENEGPAWQKFWLSMGNETESAVSGDGGSNMPPHTPLSRSAMGQEASRPGLDRGDSVMPHESASHHGADDSPDKLSAVAGSIAAEEIPFTFKFKAPSGRVHRLQVTASAGVQEFVPSVISKLGGEIDSVGGEPSVENGRLGKSGFALSYLDNDGDTVSITTDYDLLEAIQLAKRGKRDKVDLFVHDPEKAPLPATVDPRPAGRALPPPADSNLLRDRKGRAKVDGQLDEDEEEEEEAGIRKHSKGWQGKQEQDQIIQGVPNEVLLPGAIAALAVVIVGVFAISRSGNR